MSKASPGLKVVSPKMVSLLKQVGENIRLARMRRGIKQSELAERVLVSRPTIRKLEKGEPSVSLAALVQVLDVLGLADQLLLLADPDSDELGKALEMNRVKRRRVDSPRCKDDLDF